MTRQEVPALLVLSGAVLATQRVRVGHVTLLDRCRRPVGREKKKPRCLIFRTRTISGRIQYYLATLNDIDGPIKIWASGTLSGNDDWVIAGE